MKNSKDAMKVVGALVIGAAAGATLGVLFAPNKGTKTRENIAGSARRLTKNLKKKVSDEVKMIQDVANEFEGYADERLSSFKSNMDHKLDHKLDNKVDTVKV